MFSRLPTKKIVAITGAAGYLGQRLIVQLAQQPWVERIIALDLKSIPSDGRILSFQMDVTDSTTLRSILIEHGVTHLIHAAFQIVQPPGWTETQWHAMNNGGARSVVKAISGPPFGPLSTHIHLTFVSSVAVYGYRGGQTERLTEAAVVRPTMRYGKHKAEIETLLLPHPILPPPPGFFASRLKAASPLNSAIIRMAAVAGPTGKDYSHLRALTAQPFFVVANGGHALTQAIHEEDAATLICAAVERDATGVFNGAPDDSATWNDIGRLSSKPILSMPRALLNFATRFNKTLPALKGFTSEIVDLFAESLIVDNSAARSQLGWTPRYSTCDAFGQMFEALGTAR